MHCKTEALVVSSGSDACSVGVVAHIVPFLAEGLEGDAEARQDSHSHRPLLSFCQFDPEDVLARVEVLDFDAQQLSWPNTCLFIV